MEGNILYEHKNTSEVVLNKSLTFILNDLLKELMIIIWLIIHILLIYQLLLF